MILGNVMTAKIHLNCLVLLHILLPPQFYVGVSRDFVIKLTNRMPYKYVLTTKSV